MILLMWAVDSMAAHWLEEQQRKHLSVIEKERARRLDGKSVKQGKQVSRNISQRGTDVKGTRGQKRTERRGRESMMSEGSEDVGTSSGRRWNCSN